MIGAVEPSSPRGVCSATVEVDSDLLDQRSSGQIGAMLQNDLYGRAGQIGCDLVGMDLMCWHEPGLVLTTGRVEDVAEEDRVRNRAGATRHGRDRAGDRRDLVVGNIADQSA